MLNLIVSNCYIHLQSQSSLAGIFRIDQPVNIHIKVENNILKELAIFDTETRANNATNSTFEEISNEKEIMGNSTKNNTEIEMNSEGIGNASNSAINITTKVKTLKTASNENFTSSKVEGKKPSSNIANLSDIEADRSMQIDMKNLSLLNNTNGEGRK